MLLDTNEEVPAENVTLQRNGSRGLLSLATLQGEDVCAKFLRKAKAHWEDSKLKVEQKKETAELKRKIAEQAKEIAELRNTSHVDQRRDRKKRKLEMTELGCTVC